MGGITVFSDGGPAHFKNAAATSLFLDLAQHHHIVIHYNYFASNHGKSVADTIASIVKNALAAVAHMPELDYFTQPVQVCHFPFITKSNDTHRSSTQ